MGQSTSQSIHLSQDLTALTELVHNNNTTTPTTTTTPERMCTLIPFPKSWTVLPKVQTLHLGLLWPQKMRRGERKKHNSVAIVTNFYLALSFLQNILLQNILHTLHHHL